MSGGHYYIHNDIKKVPYLLIYWKYYLNTRPEQLFIVNHKEVLNNIL